MFWHIADKEYSENKAIRLISYSTGANTAGFAQNLANKLGTRINVIIQDGKARINSAHPGLCNLENKL